MPIKHTGNYTCEKCQKGFEWNHFEVKASRIDEPLIPEIIPTDRVLVHKFDPVAQNKICIEVNCPDCGYDNHFMWTVPNQN